MTALFNFKSSVISLQTVWTETIILHAHPSVVYLICVKFHQ